MKNKTNVFYVVIFITKKNFILNFSKVFQSNLNSFLELQKLVIYIHLTSILLILDIIL